jgi:hypothetical protein
MTSLIGERFAFEFNVNDTVAVASSLLELCSPRGAADFAMATGNALICRAFGGWVI